MIGVYLVWILFSVIGIVVADLSGVNLNDNKDCVPGLPGPPGPPGLPGFPGSRPLPRIGVVFNCRYIGIRGECYRFSGVYSEEECRRRYGDDQYEIWVAKQNWLDRNEAHHRYSDPIGPIGPIGPTGPRK